MTFNPLIPQPTDNLSTSQGQILTNFTTLNTIFNIDHYAFNDSITANRGLHRKIDFPATTTVSAPTGSASVFYSKSVSGVSSPYFDNAAGTSVLWRSSGLTGLTTETLGNPGALNLPNGFQMKWGQGSFSGTATTAPISYSANFPTSTDSVQVTRAGGNTGANPEDIFLTTLASSSGFTAKRSSVAPSSGLNFYWFAIGH